MRIARSMECRITDCILTSKMKLREDSEATLPMRNRYVLPAVTGITWGAHLGLVALQGRQAGAGVGDSREQLYCPRPLINKDCRHTQSHS